VSRLVVDNSVAIRWFIEDQATDYSRRVFDIVEAGNFLHVPALWLSEFCNVIRRMEIAKHLNGKQAASIIALASLLPVHEITTPNLPEIYRLAKKHGLSGYDATYLAAALSVNAPMATQDDDLSKAAVAEGIFFHI